MRRSGDLYCKLKERIAFRKKWAEQIGLGFEFSAKKLVIGPNGPKVEVAVSEEVAVIY